MTTTVKRTLALMATPIALAVSSVAWGQDSVTVPCFNQPPRGADLVSEMASPDGGTLSLYCREGLEGGFVIHELDGRYCPLPYVPYVPAGLCNGWAHDEPA